MAHNSSLTVELGVFFDSVGTFAEHSSLVCAALLAERHVAAGYGGIVRELANLTTGFRVHLSLFDYRSTPNAIEMLLGYLLSPSRNHSRLAIVGPAGSAAVAPSSLVAAALPVTLVSYAASAPSLSRTSGFFARTFPSDGLAARLLVNALYSSSPFEWRHVSVVYANGAWGSGYAAEMEREFYRWFAGDHTRPNLNSYSEIQRYRTLRSFSFPDTGDTTPSTQRIRMALEGVRNSGRSIIVALALYPRSGSNPRQAERGADRGL
jgi:hypothetical protein